MLILIILCISTIECKAEEDSSYESSVQRKLDKILSYMESLDLKFHNLNKTVHDKLSQCQTNITGDEKHKSIKVNDKPLQSSFDIFSFNKLASDSNAITRGSLVNNISQEQHGTFNISDSLENLEIILKDQLTSFRSILNKVLNRVWDQGYQLNVIADQLSQAKEECSSSLSSCSSVSETIAKCNGNLEKFDTSQSRQHERDVMVADGALRVSQIAMIEKLVSQGLDDIIEEVQSNITGTCRTIGEQLTKDADYISGQLEWIDERVRTTGLRVDEVSSVVKQSALILNRLQSNPVTESITLTYNNMNDTSNLNSNSNSKANETKTIPKAASRWFSGSKVPGRNKTDNDYDQSGISKLRSNNSNWCQSRTSLVRPSSCQQLRLAGANCTGQYYVFVQSSIMHVYCDMNMNSDDFGGGWTVILRRLDKSLASNESDGKSNTQANLDRPQRQSPNPLMEQFKAAQTNFSLDKINYKRGFGQLNDWAEFFVGLDLLHHLTRDESIYEMQVDLESSDSKELHLKYDSFAIGNEDSGFRLYIGECNETETICAPFSRLNNSEFAIKQASLNEEDTTWGWWIGEDENEVKSNNYINMTDLTQPLGRQPNGSVNHMYWPQNSTSFGPVRRAVMKIRKKRLPGQDLSF